MTSTAEASPPTRGPRPAVRVTQTTMSTQAIAIAASESTMVRAELLADDVGDRPELLIRHPEVADHQAAEVVEVLHELGPVEAELRDDRRQLVGRALLRLAGADVQDDGGPVAGEQQLRDERHGRRAPEHHDRGGRALAHLPGERAAARGSGSYSVRYAS